MNTRDLLLTAGWPEEAIPMAVAIMQAESSGNPRAYNGSGADDSYGLFQINMKGALGPERRKQWGLSSNSELYDPLLNATVAADLYKRRGNFNDWGAYTNGSYRKYLAGSSPAEQPIKDENPTMSDFTPILQQLFSQIPQQQSTLPDRVNIPGANRQSDGLQAILPMALTAMLSGDEPTQGAAKMLMETLGSQGLQGMGGGTMLDPVTGDLISNPYIREDQRMDRETQDYSRKVALANTMMMMGLRGEDLKAKQAKQASDQAYKEKQIQLQEEANQIKREANQLRAQGTQKPLSGAAVKDIQDKLSILKGLQQVAAEWSPDIANFAGGMGPIQDIGMQAANRFGATGLVPESAKRAADFYSKYKNAYELAARKGIFGSALTSTESPQWQAATLTPGIDYDLGTQRLQTLQEAAKDKVRSLLAGYGNHPDAMRMIQEMGLDDSLSPVKSATPGSTALERTKIEELLRRAETDPQAAQLLKQMDDAGLLENLK